MIGLVPKGNVRSVAFFFECMRNHQAHSSPSSNSSPSVKLINCFAARSAFAIAFFSFLRRCSFRLPSVPFVRFECYSALDRKSIIPLMDISFSELKLSVARSGNCEAASLSIKSRTHLRRSFAIGVSANIPNR